MEGFKKVFPDNVDKEYFYLQKDIKHPLLRNLHVIIDENINVYCKDIESKYDVLISSKQKTDKNLKKVLSWLENI
jgi:hypothetical protein